MGYFDYKVVNLRDMSPDDQEKAFNDLGHNMWKLVSVYDRLAYFARGPEAIDQIHPDYGTDAAGADNKNYKLDQPQNSRLFSSISSQDGKDAHAHRVRVVILDDEAIGDSWVEEVFGHTHDVKELGLLTKADGHTHTFDVDLGMTEEEKTDD
jgi:hypothetical protein